MTSDVSEAAWSNTQNGSSVPFASPEGAGITAVQPLFVTLRSIITMTKLDNVDPAFATNEPIIEDGIQMEDWSGRFGVALISFLLQKTALQHPTRRASMTSIAWLRTVSSSFVQVMRVFHLASLEWEEPSNILAFYPARMPRQMMVGWPGQI